MNKIQICMGTGPFEGGGENEDVPNLDRFGSDSVGFCNPRFRKQAG